MTSQKFFAKNGRRPTNYAIIVAVILTKVYK